MISAQATSTNVTRPAIHTLGFDLTCSKKSNNEPSTATAGSGTKEFADMLRPYFAKVAFSRPKATRKESREVYIVCIGHLKPSL